jgi:hypothetical protein
MARQSSNDSRGTFSKQKLKRKGVHAKNHNSRIKGSKNYRKKYKGQGKV